MEINYDIIIKYLVKSHQNNSKKKQSNTFSSQKNIFNYSVNFPDKFKNMLTDKFYRYGVTLYDNENNNISFWTSILTLLDKNFMIPYLNDELEMINTFKNQLLDKCSKNNLSQFLKIIEKDELRTRLKLEPDINILQLVIDVLDINIIIFDFETTNLFGLFKRDILNPWKQTLFLANYQNFWEPIMVVKSKGETQRLFDYHDQIFRKILTYDIKYYQSEKINKEFIYSDDLADIINQEKKKLDQSLVNIKKSKNDNGKIPVTKETTIESAKELINDETNYESDSSVKTNSDDDVFIQQDDFEELKKLNKTKLTKMKISELWEIVDKLKMQVDKKNPTKAVLVENILKKLYA